MPNTGNPLLGQPLSQEEQNALHQCFTNNPERFTSANYLDISDAMISLLRANFSTLAPTILQKMPNYSQLGPEIEKSKNTLVR